MDVWHDDRMPVDETDGYPIKPLSASRLCELLDYATNYGRLHEELPDGTHPLSGNELRELKNLPGNRENILQGSVMTRERRAGIRTLKEALGILPIDLKFDAKVEPSETWKIVGVDNFNRDDHADFLIAESIHSKLFAETMAKAMNETYCNNEHCPTFFKVFPAEYRLCRGMADLI